MNRPDRDADHTRSSITLSESDVVDRYRILKKLGSGGMGDVYLAEDTELHRQAALKFLPSHLTEHEESRNRFRREAQVAAALNHPNIVTVFDVGEYEKCPYIAMEYVDGLSLTEYWAEKNPPLSDLLQLGVRVCDGLQHAHDAGVVHRDIKPSNILVDKTGQPKIVDFGLATLAGGETLTESGTTLGTLGYMSPEQVEGKTVDSRSDLFSLGAVLYELITGRQPFTGEYKAAIFYSILNETPEPLERYKSGVFSGLQQIVSKALAKEADKRYQTAADLRADFLREQQTSESGVTEQSSGFLHSKTGRRSLFSGAGVILLVAALLILKPWRISIQTTDEAAAVENRLAIMYFDNVANPEDPNRLGEITANLLITDLTESDYLQVVSNQRLFDVLNLLGRAGEKNIDPHLAADIARKAHARYMLLGSILQEEPQLVLTSQLIEVQSGDAIASQRIAGESGENVFTLVDRLVVEIKKDLSLPEEAVAEPDLAIAEVTTDNIEAYRHYLEGLDCLNRADPDNAAVSFRKASELDSNFAMAYYWLTLTTLDTQEMIAAATRAFALAGTVTEKEGHYLAALLAQFTGDIDGMLAEYRQLIEQYPDDKKTYADLADTYAYLEVWDSARVYYLKAVELDPLDRRVYNELAYCYDELGNFERSMWAANKNIELAPDQANPYDTKGEIMALNGYLDDAIAAYEKAYEIRPDFWQSMERLGDLYLYKQDYARSESLYQELVANPEPAVSRRGKLDLLGQLAYRGRVNEALRMADAFRIADSIAPDPTHLFLRAQCAVQMELGNAEQGVELAERLIAELWKLPQELLVMVADHIKITESNLAVFYLETNPQRADSLIAETDLYFSQNPESMAVGDYKFMRALYEYTKQNHEQALTILEPIGSQKRRQPFHELVLRGRCYAQLDSLGRAVELLELAERLYDESRAGNPIMAAKTNYWLGLVYERSGWNDKAVTMYRKFLDLWKDADAEFEELIDARQRLASLTS